MYSASSLPVVQPPLQVLVVQSFLGSPREENIDKVGCATRGFYSTCRSSVPKTTRGVKPYGKYRACMSVKRPFCLSLTKQLWFSTSSLMVLAMQDICVPLTEHGKKNEKKTSLIISLWEQHCKAWRIIPFTLLQEVQTLWNKCLNEKGDMSTEHTDRIQSKTSLCSRVTPHGLILFWYN